MAAYDEWLKGTRQFPIVTRFEFTDANTFLMRANSLANLRDPNNILPRTNAWLAYHLMTGVIDDWIPEGSGAGQRDTAIIAATSFVDDVERQSVLPTDYDVLWAMAFVCLHTNRLKANGALAHFEAARKINPYNRALAVEHADALVYAGKPDEARDLVMNVVNTNLLDKQAPHDWFYWVLAWTYYFTRDYQNALDVLVDNSSGALKLTDYPGAGKAPGEILILWAAILGQLGDADAGAKVQEYQALRQNPDGSWDRPAFTLRRARETNPFSVTADLDHWIDGLAAAGFPE